MVILSDYTRIKHDGDIIVVYTYVYIYILIIYIIIQSFLGLSQDLVYLACFFWWGKLIKRLDFWYV